MARLNWNPPKLPRNKTAVYTWAPRNESGGGYAAAVHNGARLRNGGEIPARPWTDYALEQTDLPEVYADNFKRTEDHGQAFRATAEDYNTENRKAIEARVWSWPNVTRRRNKTTVSTPRDIVDLGNLRNSQKLEFER